MSSPCAEQREVHIPVTRTYCLAGRGLVVLGAVHGPGSLAGPRPGRSTGMVLTVWSISAGQVGGVDVSGLVVVSVGDQRTEPARQLLLFDDRADPEQLLWLLDAFQGRLGGPLEDLPAPGTGDLGFCQLPVECHLEEGAQTVSVPPWVSASLTAAPAREEHSDGWPPPVESSAAPASGRCWTVDSVSRATKGSVSWPERGVEWDLQGCTGVFGGFRIER